MQYEMQYHQKIEFKIKPKGNESFFISNVSWEGCFYPKDITIYVTRIGTFLSIQYFSHLVNIYVPFISQYQKRLPQKHESFYKEKVIEILNNIQ